MTADEAHRFGLPVAATLSLLEFNRRLPRCKPWFRPSPRAMASATPTLPRAKSFKAATKPQALSDDGTTLRNSFGPEYRMLLIGAGQPLNTRHHGAVLRGFAVTVCDPREEYRNNWRVDGVTLKSGTPDDVVNDFHLDRRTCADALTHDPCFDDLALLEALGSEAFYVGAIGSRRNNEARRARMMEHFEQTEESLASLRGPIGIYIGSKTPPEIAVSVMAEVLALKNAVPLPRDMQVGPAKEHLQPGSKTAAVCFTDRRAA
ncbi:MAG: XdhC family protein [Burkholderiaceae bacterium]